MRRIAVWTTILLCLHVSLSGQIIKTVAGACATHQYDNVPALNADLGGYYYCYPAFDNAGNMYFADDLGNTIRRLDAATGIVSIITGTQGVMGYTGDGGPAKNALIYHPAGIAVDNAGNVFFTDQVATVIRMISPSGTISTVSGPYSNTKCVVGDGGPLSGAGFEAISGIAFDAAGNLYVSDYGCNVVRKVSTSGIVTTVAGNTTQGAGGDGGPATSAQLNYPCKVAFDANGNMYIPDSENNRIPRVDAATGIITTVVGTGVAGFSGDGGPGLSAQVFFPGSIVFDNAGNYYIGEDDYRIRKVDPSGIITTLAGNGIDGSSGDGGLAQDAEIRLTNGFLGADHSGNIFFFNDYSCNIREIPLCPNPLSIKFQPQHVQVCNTGAAIFSIDATNAVTYLWQVNTGSGWQSLADNGTYSGTLTTKLTVQVPNATLDGNLYRCEVTNSCGRLTSVPDTLTVETPGPASLTIAASKNPVCSGTPVTFTATPTRGGTAPVFQWFKNNVIVGSNAAQYVDNAPANGEIVSCSLVSNDNCATNSNAVSNNIVLAVSSPLKPTVSIRPATAAICAGASVDFTATVNNPGTGLSYQWLKNGNPVGVNAATYSDASLSGGDQISCQIISSTDCELNVSATSNVVTVSVESQGSVAVSITGSDKVCSGKPAQFTAQATVAGSLQYQWFKNSNPVGGNNSSFTDVNVGAGDTYWCQVTAGGNCFVNPNAESNRVTVSFFETPKVILDQNPLFCINEGRKLDAGNFSSYLWDDGSTGRFRQISGIGNYKVTVTDNNGCSADAAVGISGMVSEPVDFILTGDTSICAYSDITIKSKAGYLNYSWSDFSHGESISVKEPGIYYLTVVDRNGCTGKDSVIVGQKNCIVGFHIPNAFTPNQDGKNDLFRPLIFGNIVLYRFVIWNRWGQIVFESTDPSSAWDGLLNGIPQDTNTFTWFCEYQLAGEPKRFEKGSVVLIR